MSVARCGWYIKKLNEAAKHAVWSDCDVIERFVSVFDLWSREATSKGVKRFRKPLHTVFAFERKNSCMRFIYFFCHTRLSFYQATAPRPWSQHISKAKTDENLDEKRADNRVKRLMWQTPLEFWTKNMSALWADFEPKWMPKMYSTLG